MELKQILDEIRDYQYREEGKEENLEREALSYKINLLKVIVEIFYTHVGWMDNPKKTVSFLGDIDDIEEVIKYYDDSFNRPEEESGDSKVPKRETLQNVNQCESFVLSKYNGENREFIKKIIFEVKNYYTKKYGALLNLNNDILYLYSETPNDLYDAIIECLDKGVDPKGKNILGWKTDGRRGDSSILLCTMNNLDKTYNMLLTAYERYNAITISAHFKEQQSGYPNYANDEMKELLIRFNTLWRDQLSSLA